MTLGLKREKKIPRQGCDHQSIAEFTNREDENFQFLVKELKSIIRRENKAGKSSAAQGHENTTEAGHNTESARGGKSLISHEITKTLGCYVNIPTHSQEGRFTEIGREGHPSSKCACQRLRYCDTPQEKASTTTDLRGIEAAEGASATRHD